MPGRFNILVDTIIPTPDTNNKYICDGTIHGLPMKMCLNITEDKKHAIINIHTITPNTQPVWDQYKTYNAQNIFLNREILNAQISPTIYQQMIDCINDPTAFNQYINIALDTLSDPVYRQRGEALIHALLFLLVNATYIDDIIAWISNDRIKQWYCPSALHYTKRDQTWINVGRIDRIFSQLSTHSNTQHTTTPIAQIGAQFISHALQRHTLVTHPCPTDYVSAIATIEALGIPYIPQHIKSANIEESPTITPKDQHIKDICDTDTPSYRLDAHIPPNQPFHFTMDTPPTNPTVYKDHLSHHGYLYNTPIFIRYRQHIDKTQAIVYAKQWCNFPYWNEHHVYQQNMHETIHNMVAVILLPMTSEQINNHHDIDQIITKKANEYTKEHISHRENIIHKIICHHIATLYSPADEIELCQQNNALFIVDEDTIDQLDTTDPIPVHQIFDQCDALEHWMQLPTLIPIIDGDNQCMQWKMLNLENILHQENECNGQPLSQHAYLSLLRQAQQENIPQLPNITPMSIVIKDD